MTSWQEILKQNRERYEHELIDLLRIPSISASNSHFAEVRQAADWVARRLETAGLESVTLFPTGEHACVYADWLHAPGKPTLLIYGHFDVQPPDPLELWSSPPFEPVIKEGCIYARGSSDMKGNLLICIFAVEAMLAAEGALPVNIKFLFEGQEEIGSRDFAPFLDANRERLSCDLVLTSDGGQWTEDQPALLLGGKGLCALQIDLQTAGMDLHSGIYGGAVPNPIHALAQLLSTLHGEDGSILVAGFYDEVVPLTAEDRAAIAAVPFDAATYRNAIGISALVGEPGYTTYERCWARPTLEVNGIWGGYQGDGVKTVIPAEAHAKITCRLVANQNPEEILARVAAHIERHTPPGARVQTTLMAGTARAYLMPADYAGNRIASEVLTELYGKPPYLVRSGGTLPILDLFLKQLNTYTIDFGFALDDERMHSPNEFFRLANFERGRIAYCRLLERFGEVEPDALRIGA